ncbi:MAG: UDP-glucose/GDP-mannose dehydrogenase family protein [Chloroflexota bacterium]|nr:UDP-glucose/GDP-mannose dehydrogenase family protein [Chloroflexota bacterium]
MAAIAVIGGGGYVGLAYAVAFAELGHAVTALDVDAEKVAALSEGRCPIFEPGLEQLLQRGLENDRLRFTTDYHVAIPDADFAFICVGTPAGPSGRADVRYISTAAQAVGRHARGHTIVVNKSTVPIGSVQFVTDSLTEFAGTDTTFSVVSNPEFLAEGTAIHDIFHPDRIILGSDDVAAADRVAELYEPLGAPVLITDPRSAEMVKYASNAFLATKISFINEVAMICESLGADVSAVAQGMGMDKRIGPRFLRPGAGFGGSCFPKDVRALGSMARDMNLDPTLLNAVLEINAVAHARIVDKITRHLGDLKGKSIAILGLAFKPDTDDIREAPALYVIEQLLAAGANVRVTDPVALDRVAAIISGITCVEDPYAVVFGADAVILMTEWDIYRLLDLDRLANAMRGDLLVDGRNALDAVAAREAGFHYVGVGRPGGSVQIGPWLEMYRQVSHADETPALPVELILADSAAD